MIMLPIFKENMLTWVETIELVDLGENKLCNVSNLSNQTVKFYKCKFSIIFII